MVGAEKDTVVWRAEDIPIMIDTDRDICELGLFTLGGDTGTGLAGVTLLRWSSREALNTLIVCLLPGVSVDWALPSCFPQFGLVFFLELGVFKSSSSAFR